MPASSAAKRGSEESTTSASHRGASFINVNGGPVMEGILYKERDHFKGWRPRYFKLDNNFLHYFLFKDDISPRNTLQLTKGVEITGGTERVNSRGTEYHIFHISHPSISSSYRLSTSSKDTCAEWVKALRSVVAQLGETRYSEPVTDAQRLLKREQTQQMQQTNESAAPASIGGAPISPVAPVKPDSTLFGIPSEYAAKVEAAALTLLQGSSPTAEGWVPMFEKPGVTATRKAGSGGAICVRGETVLPFTIPEIYGTISTSKSRMELDAQLQSFHRKKWFSHHSGVEYLRFKPVWPTAARDFCNLSHWRLLHDGTFIVFAFSAPFPDLAPEETGLVRADLIIGGYVMRPVPGGTHIHIIVQTDLCGSLPASVASLAAQSQPMVLVTLRSLLEAKIQGKRPDFTVPIVPTYDDIVSVAKRNKDAPFPDMSSILTGSKSSAVSSIGGQSVALGVSASAKTQSTAQDITDAEIVLRSIPANLLGRVNSSAETLLQGASPTSEGWEPMFEKGGVTATRRAGSAGAICVRGETTVPYTIAEIFAAISTAKAREELDSQLLKYTRLKWLSRNTGVEHLKFKPVWPTAARDFCNLTHWRLLRDGTFLTFGFSTPFTDLCPEESGVVRADLILGGYVMRPVIGGTNIYIIVQSDLGGSLPASIANMAAQGQPGALLHLRKRLETIHAGKQRPDFNVPILTSFQELIAVTKQNKDAPFPNGDGGAVTSATAKHNEKRHDDTEAEFATASEPVDPDSEPTPSGRIIHVAVKKDTNILTVANVLILLIPTGLSYFVQCYGLLFSGVVFVVSSVLALECIMRRHLGKPLRAAVSPGGCHQFKFTVNISKVVAYGVVSNKESHIQAADIVKAVVAKATSRALLSVPDVNGVLVNNHFYAVGDGHVNIITNKGNGGCFTVESPHNKPIHSIEAEMKNKQQQLVETQNGPSTFILSGLIRNTCSSFCERYQMTFRSNRGSFPYGAASVHVNSAFELSSTDSSLNGKPSASEISKTDTVLVPDLTSGASASGQIIVSIGRPAKVLDLSNRSSLQESNECTVAVCVNASLAAAKHCEHFAEKLKQYLSSPALLNA